MTDAKKTIAIIGSTGGIGSALVERLRERTEFQLFLGARGEERLEQQAANLGAGFQVLDASEPDQVVEFVKAASEQGPLAGMVNLAGSIFLKPAHATSVEDFDATIATNLRSAFGTVRAAAPALRKAGGGSIVLMSSAAARVGLANHESIAAAKAGIEGLALSAAATYSRFGVRVNTVAPGLVRTPLSAKLTSNEAQVKASEAMHPLGRIGEPEDVAGIIDWLLAGDSSWVTGQNFGVDGGLAQVRSAR